MRRLGIRPGETTPDGEYTLETVRCLGLCDRAPAALVNLERHAPATAETLLDGQPLSPRLRIGGLVKIALANIAVVDPSSLDDYHAQGGMSAYRKVLREMTPDQVIAEIKASKLLGRGGAAFSAGLKWQFAVNNPAPRHMICNADESEAGAFKDRVLMDGDPLPGHRGAAHRQLRDRRRACVHLCARRTPAGLRTLHQRRTPT